ncbi:MAG TPA: CDP-diacylglycerol--glycerol-3-phosphate 3-phosphatidyltransferase [Candidatus Aquicultor sp.]|jgi:CDP-diacylglycerol--glycerol-3-phosphate 3-phosphatidyltransferase
MEIALNVPNLLTLFRLLLVPVFVVAALSGSATYSIVAALAFGVAAATDWLDGYAARRLGQVTEFGKVADPVVDRILIAAALIVLYVKISALVPLWAIALVLGRDALMVIGWLFMYGSGKQGEVIMVGKTATAVLMISAFLLLFDAGGAFKAIEPMGIVLFYSGVLLSLISGLIYVRKSLSLLSDKG